MLYVLRWRLVTAIRGEMILVALAEQCEVPRLVGANFNHHWSRHFPIAFNRFRKPGSS
jgi:hypothetical protein